MEKKMRILVLICLGMVLIAAAFFLLRKWSEEVHMREISEFSQKQAEKQYIENEVVCSVESEEASQETAEKVNGTLKSYQDGMAVIGIEQDVESFLEETRGREDLPAMYPNYIYNTN